MKVSKKNTKEVGPVLTENGLPEAFIQDAQPTKLKTFPVRKVRFLKRCDYDSDYIEFTMIKSGIPHQYKLYDGKVYELPEDVIQYLEGIISIERYCREGSSHIEVFKKINYQFDYLDS